MTQTLTQVESRKGNQATHSPNFSWHDCAKRNFGDRVYELSYWTEAGLEKESLLQKVMDLLLKSKYFIAVDQGWSDWDLEIYRGIWSKAQIKVCAENHGGNKRLLRVRCTLKMSQFATMAMIGYSLYTLVAIILGMPEVALVTVLVGTVNAAVILYENFRLGRIFYNVMEIVAKRTSLLPIPSTSTKSAPRSAILQS